MSQRLVLDVGLQTIVPTVGAGGFGVVVVEMRGGGMVVVGGGQLFAVG